MATIRANLSIDLAFEGYAQSQVHSMLDYAARHLVQSSMLGCSEGMDSPFEHMRRTDLKVTMTINGQLIPDMKVLRAAQQGYGMYEVIPLPMRPRAWEETHENVRHPWLKAAASFPVSAAHLRVAIQGGSVSAFEQLHKHTQHIWIEAYNAMQEALNARG